MKFRNHFKDYSDIVFKTYGDRVKHWTTLNEPEITAIFNYMHGFDNFRGEKCQTTKMCKEAYTLIHNFLLSHATSVQLYREKYKVLIILYCFLELSIFAHLNGLV